MENKNLIIGEENFGNKKNLHGKKNKNTKFYSLYFYKVLTEEAFDEDSALKVVAIIKRIKERFNVSVNSSTVQDYINEFKVSMKDEYKLCGNAYKGYYTENLNGDLFIPSDYRLDDAEINILVQLLRTSNLASVGAKNEIVKKLAVQGSDELQTFIEKNTHMLPVKNLNFVKSLFAEDMVEIMNERRPIMLQLKSHHNEKERPAKEFHIYAFIPYNDTFMLVGAFENGKIANFIPLGSIKNYDVIEDKRFSINPIKLKLGVTFPNTDCLDYIKENYADRFILPTKYELDILHQKARQLSKNRESKKLTKENK